MWPTKLCYLRIYNIAVQKKISNFNFRLVIIFFFFGKVDLRFSGFQQNHIMEVIKETS